METIKRKILLENYVDKRTNSDNYGKLTADTFNINVFLTQKYDDMGIFTESEYEQSIQIIDAFNNILRLPGARDNSYFNYGNEFSTGYTDSKINDVRSYNSEMPYIDNFDVRKETYIDYKNDPINGVDRVTRTGLIDSTDFEQYKTYTFDANDDFFIGTEEQTSGILYSDFDYITREILVDGQIISVPVTKFRYKTQGWNTTNTNLSALTKEEYLFGITSKPEIQSDVFIDRGVNTVFDKHIRLSEIKNIDQLKRYNQGFYNITKI